jgi:hypothetical protein
VCCVDSVVHLRCGNAVLARDFWHLDRRSRLSARFHATSRMIPSTGSIMCRYLNITLRFGSWPIYGKPARGLARQKAHSPRRQRIGDCWMRTRVNERERRVSALTNNRVRQLHSWHHQLEFFVIHRLQPGNLHVEVDIRRCRVLLLTDSILSASIRPPPHHPST